MNPTLLSPLKKYLSAIHPIPQSEWNALASVVKKQTLSKGQNWVTAGGDGSDLGFVTSGLLRIYYTTYEGAELTRNFRAETELVGANSAALAGAPSDVSIQALEPTTLLTFPYRFIEKAFSRHACWQVIWQKISKAQYIAREKREYELLCLDARARYERFMAESKHLAGRLNQTHIASFLGITPVSLSRLRRKARAAPLRPAKY